MTNRMSGILIGCLLLVAASAPIAAAGPNVDIRVEGAARTLVAGRSVTLTDAPVVKDADPAHSCPGTSAAGALELGSGGRWNGTWSEGLGYFAEQIAGERHGGSPDFFTLWVDHRSSSAGLCQTDLKPRDDVLLFVDRCDFDAATQGCTGAPITPLGISAPARAVRGRGFTVQVVDYDANGRARPQAGASVFAHGRRLKHVTDKRGRLRLLARHSGKVTIYASHHGNARSERVVVRIHR